MIEIADQTPEEIPGLHRAALAAIRPQLIGGIAEAADHVLTTSASSVSEPRTGEVFIGLTLTSRPGLRPRAAPARATAT
jgi:hypothetical protein